MEPVPCTAAQRLCVVYLGGVFGGGGGVVAVGKCAKAAETTLRAFWVFLGVVASAWLLYVELWRYRVGSRDAGIIDMHVPAGLLVNLAARNKHYWPETLLQARL